MKSIKPLFNHPSTKRQRVFRVASLWVFITAVFLILRFVYLHFGFGIPCPLHAVTGLYCPGCGMFRAALALVRGDVWQAVRYNAFSVILLPLLFLLSIRGAVRYIRGAVPAHAGRLEMIATVGIAAASVLYAVARNLPFLAMLRPPG